MTGKITLNFSFASAIIFVIVLSFAGIIMLWLFTGGRIDDLNASREQVRILATSWENLERDIADMQSRPSESNVPKSAYSLAVFDVRLNSFLKSQLAEKLSDFNGSFSSRFGDINSEWHALRDIIERKYPPLAAGRLSDLPTSRLHFSVLLEGLSDTISDKILQETVQVRIIVFILSFLIVIMMVLFVNQVYKKIGPRQLELERLAASRAAQAEEAKNAAQTAKMQAEQVNRQFQVSVNHANSIALQAMESGKNKSELMADVSREIRIPMNAIVGFSELLAEENLQPQQKKQISIIRESSRQLLQLINDLLDYSKIETGRLEIEAADCAMSNILNSIESAMKPVAAEKEIELQIIRDEPLPQFIRTDSTRFKQCLMNLINNAIESTDKGSVAVRVSQISEKSLIRFDVEDMGTQISQEKLQHIFEPFSQVNGNSSKRSGSNGLRLAIAYNLAEILGGVLSAASTAEKGSVFTLLLPFIIPQSQVEQNNSNAVAKNIRSAAAASENVRFSGKVLVAEDTSTNQILISLMLKKLGIDPIIVENGLDAVQRAQTENFDVILMDMQMPVMNGYEATRQLRQKGIITPIVAQTACAMKGDDEKCYAAGCSDYISKPIDRKKLVDILAKYLPSNKVSPEAAPASVDMQDAFRSQPQPQSGETEIDWQLLIERIGNEQLIGEIMPIFLKDNQERMKMLAKAVEESDDKEVKFYAHSIKGASGTIGAMAIAELARQLENAGRDAEKTKYTPLFEELKARFARLSRFLSQSDWKQIASSRRHAKKA